jgi:glucose/arabinose dehydrogenase
VRVRAGAVALAMVLGTTTACSPSHRSAPGPSSSTTAARSTSTAPATSNALSAVRLATTQIASLDQPIALATRAGTRDLYVAEKGGRIRRIQVAQAADGTRTYQVSATPVLDVSSQIAAVGEQGLLGLAFSSDGRRLFTFSTFAPDGTSSLDAYDIGDATTVDVRTRHQLLSIPRRYTNHNGGELVFGPDGYLYVGIGDGGSEGDPDHVGQDPTTLFAKILRIDPGGGTGTGSGAGQGYAIPAGNPFEHGGGRPETWLYGVRNPWRFSFDRSNGDLWIGDVGQDKWEEVDHLVATGGRNAGRGANLGWSLVEGSHPYRGTNPPGGVLPVYEYSHDHGCAIVGGYVYRGAAIPGLQGAYLFADYCAAGLRAITTSGTSVTASRTFDLPLPQVQSFGEDQDGEVYALLATGPVLRIVSAA